MLSNGERSIRTRLAVLVVAVPLVLASACTTSGGASDGSKATTSSSEVTETTEATTTTEPDTDMVAVEVWAEDFCTSFSGWLDGIKVASDEVGDGVTPGDIESGKTAIAGLFETASLETQSLISDLKGAGYPDVEDGEMLSEDLIAKFEAFDEAARAAQAEAEALDVSDSAEFTSSAEELTDRFADVSVVADSFAQIDVDYPSRELTLAINASCDF
jgi:hypothetical protein